MICLCVVVVAGVCVCESVTESMYVAVPSARYFWA